MVLHSRFHFRLSMCHAQLHLSHQDPGPDISKSLKKCVPYNTWVKQVEIINKTMNFSFKKKSENSTDLSQFILLMTIALIFQSVNPKIVDWLVWKQFIYQTIIPLCVYLSSNIMEEIVQLRSCTSKKPWSLNCTIYIKVGHSFGSKIHNILLNPLSRSNLQAAKSNLKKLD